MAELIGTARIEPAELHEIIDTDLPDNSLIRYINMASGLVTKLLGSKNLGDVILAEIEGLIAAHFTAVLGDPRVKSESAGGWSATFQLGKEGEGLRSTAYGQQAIILDTTKTLASYADGTIRAAKINVISESDV